MFQVHNQGPIKLIQLTDCHLLANPKDALLGITTRASLNAVVQHIAEHHSDCHAVLATGDLAQDGHLDSYRALSAELSILKQPSFWIPGNHDCPENLAQHCQDNGLSQRRIASRHWQILMLNSHVSGEVYGKLAETELQFIQQSIASHPSLHTVIALHHHPITTQSQWMDDIGLVNHEALMALLQDSTTNKVLVFGHIHQAIDQQDCHIRALSTPSTCIQFKSCSDSFALDTIQPGYRWLILHDNGTIETGVERLKGEQFMPNLAAKGY